MKLAGSRRLAGIAAMSALALTLAACGNGANAEDDATNGSDTTTTDAGDTGSVELSGEIAGSGASSQEAAVQGWIAGFMDQHPDVTVTYDPTGSGTGREQFLNGTTLFAGTDSTLDEEELAAGVDRCFGGEVIELPLYISPIAVIYNLPSVDAEHINMDPETIAGVFTGEITSWNDPAIAEANPDVELPDLPIIPVNRSDDSGTTENFTAYLAEAAGDVWTYGAVETWPIEGTQSGAQTSGMIDVVSGAEGTIGYADASRAGDLGTIAVGVGEEYVPFSPEAAAAVVDASPAAEDATDLRLTVDLARDTTEAGTYPIVLISYSVACSTYDNEQDAANVKAFLEYVASPEGQERASRPDVAGSAPISDELREKVHAALDRITVAG
ncbi:phosphate ABC transporter substrate-binding protein PstS [uncultured Georgenia sp.]|uniref:phosphate ABC transporter substrate-binding protein PstS n=1 Tax=uncultured Georgenia sp. TaxID=378209 RepID=UPI002602F116|nr:phosphate ABC transporter substrate-binding protein PstS [uncultured Georgenia sp.]HLV05045.1 phosphate ABC transporter substrate-binding protein PstS [Actinomycetaceae bacterium]